MENNKQNCQDTSVLILVENPRPFTRPSQNHLEVISDLGRGQPGNDFHLQYFRFKCF